MQKKNRVLLLRFCGLAAVAILAYGCCGERRNRDCGCKRRPCNPVYVVPPQPINNSGTLIIGDGNTVNQTTVDNSISNTGSGSVNTNTNVNNNTNGNQTVNQETKQNRPSENKNPTPKPKPVVHDTIYVATPVEPCPDEEGDCSVSIRVKVKGTAKITRTDNTGVNHSNSTFNYTSVISNGNGR